MKTVKAKSGLPLWANYICYDPLFGHFATRSKPELFEGGFMVGLRSEVAHIKWDGKTPKIGEVAYVDRTGE